MNSSTHVSVTRKIGDVYLAVNVTTSTYSADGRTVPLAEQAAAIEAMIAGLPGEAVGQNFGEPGNVLQGPGGSAGAAAVPQPPAETSGYPDEQASEKQLAAAGVIGRD